jgi:hypothetical protein
MWLRSSTLAAAAFLSISIPAKADFIPVLDFSGGQVLIYNGSNVTVGTKFTVGASPFTITAIGLEVIAPPNGQTVRIYQDGMTVNLLSQSILSTDPTNGSGKYQYENLAAPLVLSANTTYDIVFDITNSGSVFANGSVSSSSSDITYKGGVVGDGFPTNPDPFGFTALFGPTFQGPSSPAAVPEPSALTLLATVVAGAGFLARKRRFTQAPR